MTNHTAPNHAPSHSRRVRPQPMLVVADVPATSRWYQQVLGAVSGHGGPEYEQVLVDDDIVLQLHTRDGDSEHGPLATPEVPVGNGVAAWFEVDDLDAANDRIAESRAHVEWPLHVNDLAHHREIWLRDPDDFRVILSGK